MPLDHMQAPWSKPKKYPPTHALQHVTTAMEELRTTKSFSNSPNSVATLWGSYGNRKASGVNRWCALTCSAFLATLPVKSSLQDREFAFRLRETGSWRGPFRRRVLVCAPCRFLEIGKCAKREGFESVRNRRKGCSKLEVLNNEFFSWQAQYFMLLKSVLMQQALQLEFRAFITGIHFLCKVFDIRSCYLPCFKRALSLAKNARKSSQNEGRKRNEHAAKQQNISRKAENQDSREAESQKSRSGEAKKRKSRKAEKSQEKEKQRRAKAEKQRSRKAEKKKIRKAEKQRSKEAESKGVEKQTSRKARKQESKEAERKRNRKAEKSREKQRKAEKSRDKQKSKEAEKQRSRKAESKETEKQSSRTEKKQESRGKQGKAGKTREKAETSRKAEKKKIRKAEKQRSKEAKKQKAKE